VVESIRHGQSGSHHGYHYPNAALGVAFWNSHATANAQESAQQAALEQQRTSLQQQRALADRDELRAVLDQAAASLDTVMTEVDQMASIWSTAPRRSPSPEELLAAIDAWNQMMLRLSIRLGSDSDVLQNFRAAGATAHLLGDNMVRLRPTRDHRIRFERGLARALEYQDAFTEAARQLLSP
jgi:hypothetical protein